MSLAETPAPSVKNPRGAGRKPGSPMRELHRSAPSACQRHDVTPVEVLVENLAFWYRKVKKYDAMLEKVANKIVHEQSDDPDDVGDEVPLREVREFCDTFQKLAAFREMAQKCAVDAAPYCHPRLAALAVKAEVSHNLEPIKSSDDVLESQRKYIEYTKLDPPPIPQYDDK